MGKYDISVYLTVVFMIASAVWYVRCAWVRASHPVPATWILMAVVMTLSLWMYWHSPRRSFTSNIAVTFGTANVYFILFGVIASNWRHKTLRVAFNEVQLLCLAAGAMMLFLWYITQADLIAYTFVQVIAVIAYVATVQRLLKLDKVSEPLFQWVAILLATITAIYPAWVDRDPFAWVYLARALPSTSFMVFLIWRIKRRMKRTEQLRLAVAAAE